ncbi:MAG: hypothetical protein U0892_08870 [Pirellulales bacterium]
MAESAVNPPVRASAAAATQHVGLPAIGNEEHNIFRLELSELQIAGASRHHVAPNPAQTVRIPRQAIAEVNTIRLG